MSFANSASQAKDSATSVSSCCSEPPNLQDLDENHNVCVPVRKMTYLPYTTEASTMGQENLMYPDFCVMQKAAQMPVQMQTQIVQQPLQKRLVETTRASKRSRTVFTSTQLMELEKAFKDCNYLCRSTRYNLSQALHLTERQIKIWFQNRRMKQKKDSNPKKKIGDEKVKREDCCSPAKSTSAPSPAHSADGSELNIPTSSYQQHSPQHQLMQQQPNYAVTTSAPTTALPANNYYTCNSQYAYDDKIVSNNNQASMINYQSCQQNYSSQPSNNLYSYQMNAQNYVQQQQPQHMLQTTQSQQFAQQQQLLQKQSQMYYMNYSANYKFTPSVNYAEQASLPEQQMLPQQTQQQQQQLLVEQPKLSDQSSESAVVDSVLSNFWTDNLDDITINQSGLQDKQFTSMQELLEERPMSITSL